MYSVIIEYQDGGREILDSGLSYQEAVDAVEAAKLDDFNAAKNGAPVMNCHYWIATDGKTEDL